MDRAAAHRAGMTVRGVEALAEALPSVSDDQTETALETISALTAVTHTGSGVVVCNPSFEAGAWVYGITRTASQPGGQVIVQKSGCFVDDSWSWAVGPVWVGPFGQLTQTEIPLRICLVGGAVSSNKIMLNISPPILKD